MVAPIEIPDRLNMVSFFLDDRLEEGLGEQTAIIDASSGHEVSYREVVDGSCQIANLLRELGLRIEERVLMLMLDTPEFVESYFGILRAGGVAVPANTWLRTEDYAYYLEYARPKVVIVDAEVWPQVAPVAADAPYTEHFIVLDRTGKSAPEGTIDYRTALARQPKTARTEPTYRDDVSTWLSSSGSTGKPKCVVHMHHDFVWNTIAYAQRTLQLGRQDITMAAPKLFFGYALASNMLFPFSVGGRAVLMPERMEPARYFELIERHRITQLVTVPTNIVKLLGVDDAKSRDLSSLKSLVSAGEALPPRIYRDWKERFGVEIYDGIGSAEMFHVYITNRPGDVKEGSLGRLVEGYGYRLIDDDGAPVPTGEIGTLVIKGQSAGAGYWRMRDQSRSTFWGDEVRGGDKFYVDADGYFWYCGRGDDMLKCSGIYVSPMEVENCLLGHEAVLEAGVVGVRNAAGLEKTLAYLELATGHEPSAALQQSVIEYCRERLAPYKAPRSVRFLDTLPRTETGKIRRSALRELAQQDSQ